MTNLFVPAEHRVLSCPYCKHEQLDINIDKKMFTDKEWVGYTCEKCKKLFAYIQIVERMYVTSQIKED